ncbi:dipeptidase PepV [Fundicoccus culcitae]|uniref:Dipeptidase PepV n=2 Tax=Fundicoccus culcitae TaxID=2969821 RepID=A0ABY5PA94_9LACT|nr:dipeptidase PepV [Fundicoccus culcitae]UUX35435.1 dipeptidase PepV [Fundicoccus culcitae]
MMVNWLEEVEKRQEALIDDLFRLLRIDSVRDDAKATPEAPVGPGPKAALEEFLKMAQEDGFETKQFGPWAGRIEIGSGDELMGILGHVDVVPAGSGWETDPFEPVIKDDRIYARGSSDDKGPTVAAYFAIKILRELGVEFNKRVHLIVGTDEESGWQCMDYYFKEAEMPDFGFSPDASFPIINGEKGNTSAIFTFPKPEETAMGYTLVQFKAGLRPNMVPEDAKAVIEGSNLEFIQEAFDTFIGQQEDVTGESTLTDNSIELTVYGKSAHGSTPSKGINAATYLATILQKFEFNSQSAGDFVHLIGQLLHQNFDGSKLGVDHHHDVMGDVSMNVGIVNFDRLTGGSINANFRYPEGTDPETMLSQILTAVEGFDVEVKMTDAKEPHYVPATDPLVETLLDVYHTQTGFEAHEQSIGGGTYGRLMPRGVAYGALFPDSIDTMHQANEFLAIKDLTRATAIYAEAIYRLTR